MNAQQLQQEISKTQEQLQRLQEQLEIAKAITIETAQPGDTLPDGTVVVARYEDSVLLAAPKTTEVECKWTPEFPEVFKSLKKEGFIPSQWHVPSKEELKLAYKNCKQMFSSTNYWSSMEYRYEDAFYVNFLDGLIYDFHKAYTNISVRAFRRVYL